MDEQTINDGRVAANKILVNWSSEDFSSKLDEAGDWRSEVVSKLADGDIAGMAEAAGARLQGVLIEVAVDPKVPPQTRVAAATNVLGQIGHGEVKQVQHSVHYNSMESGQLEAMVSSKLARIVKNDPNFDLKKVLPGDVVDITESTEVNEFDAAAEVTEVPSIASTEE